MVCRTKWIWTSYENHMLIEGQVLEVGMGQIIRIISKSATKSLQKQRSGKLNILSVRLLILFSQMINSSLRKYNNVAICFLKWSYLVPWSYSNWMLSFTIEQESFFQNSKIPILIVRQASHLRYTWDSWLYYFISHLDYSISLGCLDLIGVFLYQNPGYYFSPLEILGNLLVIITHFYPCKW